VVCGILLKQFLVCKKGEGKKGKFHQDKSPSFCTNGRNAREQPFFVIEIVCDFDCKIILGKTFSVLRMCLRFVNLFDLVGLMFFFVNDFWIEIESFSLKTVFSIII
jgi:hypothetical protein